jgi:hypothetical protein
MDSGPGTDAGGVDGGSTDGGAVDGGATDAGDATDGGGDVDGGGDADGGAADGGAAPDGGATPDGGACGTVGPSSPLECFKQCTNDSDCEYVQTGSCCCSCNMGGAVEAINSDYVDEWAAMRSALCAPVDCSGIFCIALYNCPDDPPTCVSGQCQTSTGVVPL